MYFARFEVPGSYTLLLRAGDLLMRSCNKLQFLLPIAESVVGNMVRRGEELDHLKCQSIECDDVFSVSSNIVLKLVREEHAR